MTPQQITTLDPNSKFLIQNKATMKRAVREGSISLLGGVALGAVIGHFVDDSVVGGPAAKGALISAVSGAGTLFIYVALFGQAIDVPLEAIPYPL